MAPSETLYGESLVILCHTAQLPVEYASRVHIEWWGPNGTTLNGSNDVRVLDQESSGSTLSRRLAFSTLRSTMDGGYTCHFHIHYMNETYTETRNYTLKVSG